MADSPFDQVRTEITHAQATADQERMESLEEINEAIKVFDERTGDPNPERLESIIEEIDHLESSAEGETQERLRTAREQLRAFQEDAE